MSVTTPLSPTTPRQIRQYQTAGGVVIYNQQMLLLLRPKRQEIRLPKGHIDPEETPAVTALRETTEESGYADLVMLADLGSQIVTFDYQTQPYIRTEFYFLMTLQSQAQVERPLHDAMQFQVVWLPLAEGVAALTFEAEKNMARKAVEAYARL
jgi:8-oxo-dGTP pyrophosphatase MutT (NUDIX family)